MPFALFEHQEKALAKMKNGCVLHGGTGSGKSLTAIAYYFYGQGGKLNPYKLMPGVPKDLYIITTAQKRDKMDWEGELIPFRMSPKEDCSLYKNKVIIDSWNNIGKYDNVKDAFFIFDEQRVVGTGAWVKSFLKITKANEWILLSATPGDTWSDYIPIFIANGFYKNRTQFNDEHVVYARFSKFPKIDRYVNTNRLTRLRDSILIDMDFDRHTIQHHEDVWVNYSIEDYKKIFKERWNPYEDKPIKNASELCYLLRKIVNSDTSRQWEVLKIMRKRKKAIIFYNFDYELEILKSLPYEDGTVIAEWNGHKHQEVPDGNQWVYLVQYTAGAEGWNCTRTDTTIFFSQNYSYKVMIQSSGRIDRLNTMYIDLYYYHLKSKSGIDVGISRALANKKKFNEGRFAGAFNMTKAA